MAKVVNWLFEKLGIGKVLREILGGHRVRWDIVEVVKGLVSARLEAPASKLRDWSAYFKEVYPGLVKVSGISLHHVYRTLRYVARHKDAIEAGLWDLRCAFSQARGDVVLYDLTTLYWESVKEDEVRRRGWSKDGRGDVVQIVLGLLSTEEGAPIGFEVFEGNRWEGSTITKMMEKLKSQIGMKRFVIVADKGLFCVRNLELLEEQGVKYVVGFRLRKMAVSLGVDSEELYDLTRMQPIAEGLYYREYSWRGRRVIVVWSKERSKRDHALLDDKLQWLREIAEKGTNPRQLLRGRWWAPLVKIKEGKVCLNQEAIEQLRASAGFTALVTNDTTLSPQEVIGRYSNLWHIEDAFRQLKDTLEVRPMFVWTKESILGHLLICFIAYWIESYIAEVLRAKRVKLKSRETTEAWLPQQTLTAKQALRILSRVEVCKFKLQKANAQVTIYLNMDSNARKIFRALGIPIPENDESPENPEKPL